MSGWFSGDRSVSMIRVGLCPAVHDEPVDLDPDGWCPQCHAHYRIIEGTEGPMPWDEDFVWH
jgi:hypothetical protein